jgi:hypothetical protein
MKATKDFMCIVMAVTIIFVLGSIVLTEAAVMYSNIGPSESFSATAAVRASGPESTWNAEFDVAEMFAPVTSGYIGSIGVGVLSGKSIYETVQIDFWIAADNGGLPDQILEATSCTMSGYTRCVQTATFSGKTYLTAGTNYWVCMSAPGDNWLYWYASDPEISGRVGYKTTGDWDAFDYYAGSSLRVNSVPEPATICLLTLGALSLRRRK